MGTSLAPASRAAGISEAGTQSACPSAQRVSPCQQAEAALVPTTQPAQKSSSRRGLVSREAVGGSTAQPVPDLPLSAEAPPAPGLQSTSGPAGNVAANSEAGLRNGFCRLSASALLAEAPGRGLRASASGESQNGSQVMYHEKSQQHPYPPGKGNQLPTA